MDDDLLDKMTLAARDEPPAQRAASLLLAEHGYWPTRPDFRTVCLSDDGTRAWIDWQALDDALADGTYAPVSTTRERAVLDAARSLVGPRAAVNLNDLVVGTDAATVAHLLHALATAAQWPALGLKITATAE